MIVFELTPNNGRKSFYGKAKVIVDNESAKLQSYEMIVAEYNTVTKEYTQHGKYSRTTNTHIKAFKKYYGIQ